jgi:predicted acyltransferase
MSDLNPISKKNLEKNISNDFYNTGKKRILSIDIFRGATLTAMVFVNTTSIYDNTPEWLLHANDVGLTFTDLIAPFFIFAIALTYKISLRKFKTFNKIDRFIEILKRYLTLFAMGMLGSIEIIEGYPIFRWGTLTYIGLAGIFTYLFINRNWKIRLIIVIICSIIYQILLDFVIFDIIFHQIEGGLYGTLSWFIMMLLSTILAEFIENKKFIGFLYSGILLLFIGIVLHFILQSMGLSGCSRQRVSISYNLICIGLAGMVYYIIYLIYDIKESQLLLNFFQEKGKNPIFLYTIHGIILGILYLELVQFSIPFLLVLIIAISHVSIISVFGHVLDKREIYIRL